MKLRKSTYIFLLWLFMIFFINGCAQSKIEPVPAPYPSAAPTADGGKLTAKSKMTGEFFATWSQLRLYDDFSKPGNVVRFEQVWEELKEVLSEIEQAVSVSVETSDIARFNALAYGEEIEISGHTAAIILAAKEGYAHTDGMFNPAVYPLVDLWGFTPRFTSAAYAPVYAYDRERGPQGLPLPEERYISAFLKLADFDGIVLSGDAKNRYTLQKMVPPVEVDGIFYEAKIDLGGIAKGYAVDAVMELLTRNGYEYGVFSCGSSSMGLMKSASPKSVENGTQQYEVHIRHPRSDNRNDAYLSVAQKDARLSTSGDYDHSYVLDGVRYSHIINPATGYPMNTELVEKGQKGVATATVLGENATVCEVLSTALCAMEPKRAIRFINEQNGEYSPALVLYDTASTTFEFVTDLPPESYLLRDEAFLPVSSLDGDGSIVYEGRLFE